MGYFTKFMLIFNIVIIIKGSWEAIFRATESVNSMKGGVRLYKGGVRLYITQQ